MSDSSSNTYDVLPYMGRVHRYTHIEKLACYGLLFSYTPPSIHKCRVLDLGCGDGTNIINMAYQLPHSQFIGIDGSKRHIETGKQIIQVLDVENISLMCQDLMQFDHSLGKFDYIICHGVFSWVPEEVRNKILQIIKQNLDPNGLAYISYNTLPGWRMDNIIRDMMRYHSKKMTKTNTKIEQAKAIVQFIESNLLEPQSPYGKYVKSRVDYISCASDDYIFHEYLERDNQAFYFYEFNQMLDKHKLQYFGDADFNTMSSIYFPKKTRETLDMLGKNLQDLEQYMDFLRFRKFRCSIIVHNHHSIDRVVTLDPFKKFRYSFRPPLVEENENINSKLPNLEEMEATLKTIVHKEGTSFTPASQIELYRIALTELTNQWPNSVHFDELIHQYEQQKNISTTTEDKFDLAMLFQALFLKGLVELHLFSPNRVNSLSQYPLAAPLARYQSLYQDWVSTQSHHMVALKDNLTRFTLGHLDGNHTIDQILEKLNDRFTEAKVTKEFLLSSLEAMLTNGIIEE